MPGIDGMPPMGDVGGCSRRNFLKGAGLVVLSGALLAACQKGTDEGNNMQQAPITGLSARELVNL